VRRFDAAYLRDTRRGMWADRGALVDLDLSSRERVLDVGCGTGEFSAALRAGTDAPVVGVDADVDLLEVARHGPDGADDKGELRTGHTGDPFPVVGGDALSLPVRDDAVDLAACQALLINLAEPAAAVGELARVSADLVAAVEPDNAAVSVDSTVDREETLERRARAAYLDGVDTDVTLGAADDLFREAGVEVVSTRRHDHARTVEPPYDERITRAQAVEGFLAFGQPVGRATYYIEEDPLATCFFEGIFLAVGILAAGRDAGVADEHGETGGCFKNGRTRRL